MAHEFIIRLDGKLKKYTDFVDIPESFDNLIKFLPEIIPPPHTDEDHRINDQWHDRLKELMKRETK